MRPTRVVLLLFLAVLLVTYFARWTRVRLLKDRLAAQLSFQVRELLEENQLLRSQNLDLRLRLQEAAKDPPVSAAHDRCWGYDAKKYVLLSELQELARIVEVSHYSTLTGIRAMRQDPEGMEGKLADFGENSIFVHDMLSHRIQNLKTSGMLKDFAADLATRLAKETQGRLHALQNPPDCESSKFLHCDLNRVCGFGCQIHHAVFCLAMAYGTNRTLSIKSRPWRYHHEGWEGAFLPVTSCDVSQKFPTEDIWTPEAEKEGIQHLRAEGVDFMKAVGVPYAPNEVPRELHDVLGLFHTNPPTWWVGQLLAFLMRPNDPIRLKYESHREKLGWGHPLVGVHIRRSDKLLEEAKFHELDEYMGHVGSYYRRLEETQGLVDVKRVFLATDDPRVFGEAASKYPQYTFLFDEDISRVAQSYRRRFSGESLEGVLMDIFHLADSDYLVCTLSSQVCRVGYELMQTKHLDASGRFVSLDDPWYYGGGIRELFRVITRHTPGHGELALEVGDIIQSHSKLDGWYWVGENLRTGETGNFLGFKVAPYQAPDVFPARPLTA